MKLFGQNSLVQVLVSEAMSSGALTPATPEPEPVARRTQSQLCASPPAALAAHAPTALHNHAVKYKLSILT